MENSYLNYHCDEFSILRRGALLALAHSLQEGNGSRIIHVYSQFRRRRQHEYNLPRASSTTSK